jgi:hypothetical protein
MFQLYWWRNISGALPCIISGTNGHLSRTTDVPELAGWLPHMKESKVPVGIRTYSGEGKWFEVNNLNRS